MKYYHVPPQVLQIPQLRPTNKHQTGSNHHKLMPQLGLKIAPRSLTKRKNDQLWMNEQLNILLVQQICWSIGGKFVGKVFSKNLISIVVSTLILNLRRQKIWRAKNAIWIKNHFWPRAATLHLRSKE